MAIVVAAWTPRGCYLDFCRRRRKHLEAMRLSMEASAEGVRGNHASLDNSQCGTCSARSRRGRSAACVIADRASGRGRDYSRRADARCRVPRLVRADGTGAEQLLRPDQSMEGIYPGPSPDGSKYVTMRDGTLFIVDAATAAWISLGYVGEEGQYSPAGDRIAYVDIQPGLTGPLWVMKPTAARRGRSPRDHMVSTSSVGRRMGSF